MSDQPIYIQSLRVENFRRVVFQQIDAEGRHVVIKGDNSQGKSSLFRSLESLFQAISAKADPDPIHHGAPQARIDCDLGEFQVKEVFKPGKAGTCVVTRKDGMPLGMTAREFLDNLRSQLDRDPLAFLSKRKQDQVDDFLAIFNIKPPCAEIEKLTGEKHDPLTCESADGYLMRLSADKTGLYYTRRTDANRRWIRKKEARAEQEHALRMAGGPLKEDETPPSQAEAVKRISELQKQAESRRKAIAEAEADAAEVRKAKEKTAQFATKIGQLVAENDKDREEIARITKRIEARAKEAIELQAKFGKATEIVDELEAQAKESWIAGSKLQDPSSEIATLQKQLETSEAASKVIAKRKTLQAEFERLCKEESGAEDEHKQLESTLEAIRDLRLHLGDGIDFGIPGVAIRDGEILLNGVTLAQAGKAEGVVFSVALAARRRPEPRLKVMWIDNGEALGPKMRELLLKTCSEHGYQVWLTCVDGSVKEGLELEFVEAAERIVK